MVETIRFMLYSLRWFDPVAAGTPCRPPVAPCYLRERGQGKRRATGRGRREGTRGPRCAAHGTDMEPLAFQTWTGRYLSLEACLGWVECFYFPDSEIA